MIGKGNRTVHKGGLERILLVIVIAIISLIYFKGIPDTPFHPDESTQLYMSSDFDLLFSSPQTLFWRPESQGDPRQLYRLLDPPLTRYIAGIGRAIASLDPLPADWDWSLTWQQNQVNHALPNPDLLRASRLAIASFFPITLLLAYHLGKTVGSPTMGWINLLLMASNALVLLHTRRVMAESTLLFGCLASLWAILVLKKRRWLAAIPVAIAFNAKYSAAPLLIGALVAIFWPPTPGAETLHNRLKSAGALIAVFIAITVLLNPFLWSSPIKALSAAADARAGLMANQTQMIAALNPAQAPEKLPERLAAMIVQLFIAQPAVADVGNYLQEISPSADRYFAYPLHNLFRGLFAGGFYLAVTITGLIITGLNTLRREEKNLRFVCLFFITAFFQTTALLVIIPLSFQRYYLPLLPFITLSIVMGISTLIRLQPVNKINHDSQS